MKSRTAPNDPPPPGQSSARPLGEMYTTTTTAPIPYPNGTTRYEQAAANPAFAPQLEAESLILEIGESLTCAMEAEGIDVHELSRRSGVSANAIRQILRGEKADLRAVVLLLSAIGKVITITPAKAPTYDPAKAPIVPVPGQDSVQCTRCGVSLGRISMYSCSHDGCPMFGRTRMGG
jgi:hypothetical protein